MIELTLSLKLLGLVVLLFLYGVGIGLSYRLFIYTDVEEEHADRASHFWPITIPFYSVVGLLYLVVMVIQFGIKLSVGSEND